MLSKNKLIARASALRREITAIYYAYRHPDMPLPARAVILFTLAYALSPVDLIPDFIPVIGYLDDLIILPALIALSIKLVPPAIMDESRARAEREPVQLTKKPMFAAIFIAIWAAVVAVIAVSLYRIISRE